jgi:hypothetical protein
MDKSRSATVRSQSRFSLGKRTCLRFAGGAWLLLFNVKVKRVGGGTPFEALSRVIQRLRKQLRWRCTRCIQH